MYLSLFNDSSALFVAVQTQGVFPDSKTFVDCVPKQALGLIENLYLNQYNQANFSLVNFVHTHFELPKAYASDFQADTSKVIEDHIKALWPILTRKPHETAPTQGSLIPLPNAYVVPGGRFGEVYYWDSFFTMLGLQCHHEINLIEQMVDNFAYLLNTYGLIPNGNRTYYLGRSQPPFFCSMVSLLAKEKGDSVWLKYLPFLQKEYDFWMDGAGEISPENPTHRRVVRLPDGSILNRYFDDFARPRPESYREDVAIARASTATPQDTYRHLRAGAESGWDFSSRWFADTQNIATIHTTDIIPIDLNCLLLFLEQSLRKAYLLAGHTKKFGIFSVKVAQRLKAIDKYCWNESKGFYFDYDFIAASQTPVFSLAGVYPLYFEVANPTQAEKIAGIIEKDFLHIGGLVSTLAATHEQWDSPNGWAPLHYLAIRGLEKYGFEPLASTITQRWIATNKAGYMATGKLMEKYNVVSQTAGGGGEYPTQDGFGWTNGVLARLLGTKGEF